ncbi:MAG: phosphoribosylanthranilate isomerase [Chthoniobacteraceae bacterium]
MRVKICGITNREDAEAAIASGADALGFNFFPGSKRFLSLDENAAWMRQLSPVATRVAVLVDAPIEEARRIARHPAIDAVQLHGHEDAPYGAELTRLGVRWIKALPIDGPETLVRAESFGIRHILLDAHVPGEFGGTGTLPDLKIVAEIVRSHPDWEIFLAGGLRPENVAAIVREVAPFAVDVASGVERAPGRKDPALMEAFCAALR